MLVHRQLSHLTIGALCSLALGAISAVDAREQASQKDNAGSCGQLLPHVRALEAKYLNAVDGREFHLSRVWKVPQASASEEPPGSISNEFWVCFRLRDRRLRIRRRLSNGNEHVVLLNERYSASVLRIGEGYYTLRRGLANPRWYARYPDFHAVGKHGSRLSDAVMAVLSPIVACGLPATVALAGTRGFSSRCVRTPGGSVKAVVSTTVAHRCWFARPNRQWHISFDPARQYACVSARVVSTHPTVQCVTTTRVFYADGSSLEPSRYVVEQVLAETMNGTPAILQRDLLEYTILGSTACRHPAEAFYLPYYGIDESAIEQTSSSRALVLAAGSVTALVLALLALLALRRARATERASGG